MTATALDHFPNVLPPADPEGTRAGYTMPDPRSEWAGDLCLLAESIRRVLARVVAGTTTLDRASINDLHYALRYAALVASEEGLPLPAAQWLTTCEPLPPCAYPDDPAEAQEWAARGLLDLPYTPASPTHRH